MTERQLRLIKNYAHDYRGIALTQSELERMLIELTEQILNE